MHELCEVDVFWTVQNGNRFSISLTESDAWLSLEALYAYEENPDGWSVEQTRELVPVVLGEVAKGEGEAIDLDENGQELSRRTYEPIHILWSCPRCGIRHNTDLFANPIEQKSPASNPSIWFCERGEGLVLVRW